MFLGNVKFQGTVSDRENSIENIKISTSNSNKSRQSLMMFLNELNIIFKAIVNIM